MRRAVFSIVRRSRNLSISRCSSLRASSRLERLFCDSFTVCGVRPRRRLQTDLRRRDLVALEVDEPRVQVVQLLTARGLLRGPQQLLRRHVGELGDLLLGHEDAGPSAQSATTRHTRCCRPGCRGTERAQTQPCQWSFDLRRQLTSTEQRTVDGKGGKIGLVEVTPDDLVGLANLVLELDLDAGPSLGRVALDEVADILPAVDDLHGSAAAVSSLTHAQAEVHSEGDRGEDGAHRSARSEHSCAPFAAAVRADDEVAVE